MKKPVTVNKKRWAMYAAGAAVAAFSGAQTAEADITHVVLDNDAGEGIVGVLGNVSFTLDNGSTLNFANQSYTYPGYPTTFAAGVGVDQADGGIGGGVAALSIPGVGLYGSNVSSGVNISTLNFQVQDLVYVAYASGGPNSGFDAGVEGFTAFSFNNGTQFGWARLTFDETAATDTDINTFVVNEFAYTTAPEHQITVGQTESVGGPKPTGVPEPTSLGLLALGAVGVLANRRRKIA